MLVLFGPLSSVAAQAFFGQAPIIAVVATWGIILALLVCSAMLGLSHAGLEVAIERDWYVSFLREVLRTNNRITTIAGDDNYQLTRLNTHMRRIDLISKLCAPVGTMSCNTCQPGARFGSVANDSLSSRSSRRPWAIRRPRSCFYRQYC